MLDPRRTRARLVPSVAVGALALTAFVAPAAQAAEVTHTIAEVQGTGATTPLSGQTVTVAGIVTAVHLTGGYNGFYLQTAGSGGSPDATPDASDGVFVFLGTAKAAATTLVSGQSVRVTGVAGEFVSTASGRSSSLTQLNASGAAGLVEVVDAATQPLPAATELPDTLVGAARESLEGMLVAPTGTYLVASLHELYNFGSVWLSAGSEPLVKSTAVLDPQDDADADGTLDVIELAQGNADRRIVLDDARSTNLTSSNPDTPQPYLSGPVRTQDVADLAGVGLVLSEGFGLQRLQPLAPISAATPAAEKATFTSANPRPATPAAVGGDVQVGAFNVLNYFTTLGARGAATPEAFAAQKSKIVAAISGLGADVVALQEIENTLRFGGATADVALADLVAGLNAQVGAEVWAYVATPTELTAAITDDIMSAIIYRSDVVTPVGAARTILDETVWGNAREPIAQVFSTGTPSTEFVVVANHFKSKSGGTEPADGQGAFTADRVAQAQSLLTFAGTLADEVGTQDVVLLGDFNAYAQEDPIDVLTDAGWVDLAVGESASYTFDGELGSLDHAIASPTFAARVTGVDVWDINADEWDGYQFGRLESAPEAGTIYRSSDHDPILVGISAVPQPVEIDILGINDFHGRIEAGGANSPLLAGAAVLSGAVDAFRAQNPNTLFVSAGDNIGASTFTSFIQQDVPTLEALNAMELDVSALGNHEFDQGRTDIDDRVAAIAEFPYIAANVIDSATGEPAYEAFHLETVDGVEVAFIGAVTEELPSLVSPAGIASLEVTPIVPAVNEVAAALSDGDAANGEADVVVALVHEGPQSAAVTASTDDSVFGQIVAGLSGDVDVIFSGHTHQKFAHEIAVPGGNGETRTVIQSGQYGENLAHVTVTVDPVSGDVTSSGAVVPLTAGAPTGAGLFPADPEVAAIVADAVAVAEVEGGVSLGSITGDLNRAALGGNRGGESTLGNLVADVQLWATQRFGTQIAFMNPGGLRADLTYASTGLNDPAGNVTYKEAATVQSFANTLVTLTLTGTQVRQVLEEQWQPAGASRPFLKLGVAGMTYTYDPTAAAGSRITDVWVSGTPLDPNGSYKVVANSFLAAGGDNFTTLGLGTGKADSGQVDLQAFVDYFAAKSPVSPDLAQRAVGVDLPAAPAGGYAAGASVTVALSSLAMTGGEVQPTEVVLSIGGTQIATGALDLTSVPTTDEAGRSTVTFTVPAGLSGQTARVDVTVPGTGTATSFTIPLAAAPVPTCTVAFQGVQIGRSFLGSVTVRNDMPTPIKGWTMTWRFTQGERATAALGASVRQAGPVVTARSTWLTERIRPGQTATFVVLGQAPQGLAMPTDVTLNGKSCTIYP